MTKHEQVVAEHANIYVALAAAQGQMGRALKDSKNPHFKSSYADLSSVTGACMPALSANGISLTQPTGRDEHGADFVDTILTHGGSETNVFCRVFLVLGKRDMQSYGSAVTYARRYGLMCMAGIAPEDDDGSAAVASAPRNQRTQSNPAPEREAIEAATGALSKAETFGALKAIWDDLPRDVKAHGDVVFAKEAAKARIDPAAQAPANAIDTIPY